MFRHRRRAWPAPEVAFLAAAAICFAPAASLAAPGEEPALVLGVSQSGRFDAHLTRALSERLVHNGEHVLPDTQLSLADRLCVSAECFDRVATREKARLLLSTSLQQNGTNNYYIVSVLYDAVKHVPYQRQGECDCLPEALAARVSDMADQLLKEYRQPASAPGSALTPERLGNAGMGAEPIAGSTPQRSSLSRPRKIAAGVLGGIGLLSLGGAIGLHVIDNTPVGPQCNVTPMPPNCLVWDTRAGYGVLYGVAAASAISIAVILLYPSNSKTKKQPAATAPADSAEVR